MSRARVLVHPHGVALPCWFVQSRGLGDETKYGAGTGEGGC